MMTYRQINRILLLFFFTYALTACIDDDFIADNCFPGATNEVFREGYSLNFMVTLDDMGGTRAAVTTPELLKKWEDYIDPEKFRVLIFNHEDKLLFESKSRWVRQFNDDNRWLVSVPVFTYGDDVYKDEQGKEWPWKEIRQALISEPFKIAILANRPEMEWYPGFKNTGLPEEAKWMDNTGPHWTPNDYLKKNVFDLHHCQYDAIYHGKSYKTSGTAGDAAFYDFIAEGYNLNKGGENTSVYVDRYPQMGATSSWVDWNKKDSHGWEKSPTILPSQEHPIPMYGIQEFQPISGWQEGTPFNLSEEIPGDNISANYNKKSISLLRSVVKLELVIPEEFGKPKAVLLSYPNVYARCEPMDVWTPTDELWEKQHGKNGENDNCEISSIMHYGPISRKGDKENTETLDFQKRISWFYGIWKKENKWDFKGTYFNKERDFAAEQEGYPYPRIFNTCTQRNTSVVCDDNGDVSNLYSDKCYHYVAYLGERNINDPSDLAKLGDSGGGKPTVIYWNFDLNGKMYGLPITDYSVSYNPALDINPTETYTGGKQETLADVNSKYMTAVMNLTDPKDSDKLPWALIRNHIYRITLSRKDNPVYNWNFAQDLKFTSNSSWVDEGDQQWWKYDASVNGNSLSGISGITGVDNLKFTAENKSIQIKKNDAHYIRLTKSGTKIILPNLTNGQIITIDCAAGGSGGVRASYSYMEHIQGLNTDNNISDFSNSARVINRWQVNTNGAASVPIQFEVVGSNVDFYLIKVTNPKTQAATRTAGEIPNGFVVASENFHSKTLKAE